MNKTVVKMLALLCAALLLSASCAFAQELQIGDLVYVPAMGAPGSTGTISLTVEGVSLREGSDEPQIVPLAGAQFGVYVYSSTGELTPWANPLYPSEPMRVRTGEGETLFSLPQGMEFYLKQESAPQGYLYDPDALIPVQGDSVVVRNAMPGQIAVSVVDELGRPIAGVELTVSDPDGMASTVLTDENGMASFACEVTGLYTVNESALPEGVFAVLSSHVSDVQGDKGLNWDWPDLWSASGASVQVAAQTGARARVTFSHPATGTVCLSVQHSVLGDDGEAAMQPLTGVRMDLLGDAARSVVTDEDGLAQVALLEGTYEFALSYAGALDAVLPAGGGLVIVNKGQDTLVELAATESTGRIAVQAQAARAIGDGSVTLVRAQDGQAFGPYGFDADGLIVSEPLTAGLYYISSFEVPSEMELGYLACGGFITDEAEALDIDVTPGMLTTVTAELYTWETQIYDLLSLSLDDEGHQAFAALTDDFEFDVLDASGEVVGDVTAQEGRVRVSMLSGEYALRMDAEAAQKLGLNAVSRAFSLPSDEDTIVFAGNSARLHIYSVDENAMSIPDAQYIVTDGAGNTSVIDTGADGEAVTLPLVPGEIVIESLFNPQEHDAAQTVSIWVDAGDAREVQMAHPAYGETLFHATLGRIDELGRPADRALGGAEIRIYRVESDGGRMTDTGVVLTADENGIASVRLPQGQYAAQVQTDGLRLAAQSPQTTSFSVQNMQSARMVELVCIDALGGVCVLLYGGELTPAQMAQVLFEVTAPDGTVFALTPVDNGFYVGGLEEGTYVLRQTQMPQGYTLCEDREVSVWGGDVSFVSLPLEEYAVVTVNKTGLTFNDQLQTFVVPLTGEYGVYTMQNGQLVPYPSEDEQATVWANVTPEQVALGMQESVRLPASVDGTTYYLRELSGAQGFAGDANDYEVTVFAGGTAQVECTVSSDRGFFSVDLLDAYGAHVSGGEFELRGADGEIVLSFEMGETAYQNPMAIPVGTYTLRQLRAAQGYTLAASAQREVIVEPYLTQGGMVTHAVLTCASIPQAEGLTLIGDLYAAREQGLTMVTVDGGELAKGEMLRVPQLTLRLTAENGERIDAIGVVLGSAKDATGGQYAARVEYCLTAGGWQPSDARMTGTLETPTAISLADVEDDICAVRITYLDAQTGLEQAGEGFMPGGVTLSMRVGSGESASITAQAGFSGEFIYQTEFGGELLTLESSQQREFVFVAEGDGVFGTVLAGRDGRISGVVFADEDADGLLDVQETRRLGGLNVSLVDGSGNVVETQQTDENGRYAFTGISSGTYSVRFEAGEDVIFSRGEGYSQHLVSGVRDTRYGESEPFVVDSDHTDRLVNAGCVRAARIQGQIIERVASDETNGYAGLNIELHMRSEGAQEEPVVVTTSDEGEFSFVGLMPGRYEVLVTLPEGYLCAQARDGMIVREFELVQGDAADLDEICLQRSAAVSGFVRVDEDGDGVIGEGASGLGDVGITLLRVQDGHAEQIAQTVSGADGSYRFDGLFDGEYSVLFELSGEWTFTRGSADSLVDSGMFKTGSTPSFALLPGQEQSGINAGATVPAQLTVSVFKDLQRDGSYSGRESMLEGVSITLVRVQDNVSGAQDTRVTDASGTVTFEGVSPGEYMLRYQMPGTWRATVPAEPGQYPVSCVPQSMHREGESDVFTLAVGETGVHMVIGATPTGSVSGTVYYDDDGSASRSEGENPVSGLQVELLDSEQNVVAQTVSAQDGSYAFEGLVPGRYRVRFTSAENSIFSGSERSMERGGVQPSDGPVSTTRVLTIYANDTIATADAGVVRLGGITGVIWTDRNADCAMGENEAGLAGVSVQLMNGAGRSIIATAVTDESGAFTFERVQPGSYVLRVDAPEEYVFSGALQGSALPAGELRDGRCYSSAFTLLGGAWVQNVGYGLLRQGSISGRIWQDDDYDGMMSETESGLRYANVTLVNASGEAVAEKQTGRSGEYTFENLMPGEYTVSVTLPQGYVFTVAGGDSRAPRTDDAQAEVSVGLLEMGGAIEGVDIGALEPALLSGVIWLDKDDDGRRQAADEGIEGARVRLEVLSGADAGRAFETAADETGAYRIDGVMPGQVRMTFEIDDGYAFAKQLSGSRRVSVVPRTDALTAQTEILDVKTGEALTYLDAGVVSVGVISGDVWEDILYDGVRGADEYGVPGVRLALIDAGTGEQIREVTTGDDGAFEIGFVRLGAYEVEVSLPDGMIFTCGEDSAIAQVDASSARLQYSFDVMGEGLSGVSIGAIKPSGFEGRLAVDENEDGIPGETEPGLQGAVVTVMQGGTAIATARTREDGSYSLDALRPGEYRVRITLPEDTLFALGTALSMSDADAQEGETPAMTLAVGEKRALDPIAVVRTGRISGRAWSDENVDGEMGASEPALTGVVAELLSLDAGAETPVARTQVDNSGRYAFTLLRKGTYAVRFTLPNGMLFTDRNGQPGGSSVTVVPGNVGATDAMTLVMGEEIDGVNVGGIFPGYIGDTVWLDVNGNGLQDYKEPLVPGVELTLLRVLEDGTHEEAAVVTSDEYGYYRFDSLRPGSYVVAVDANRLLTMRFGAPLGEIDSDVDPQTGMTDVIVLQSGQTLRNIDVGLLAR